MFLLIVPGSLDVSRDPLSLGQLAKTDNSEPNYSNIEPIEIPPGTPRLITVKSVDEKKSPTPSASEGEILRSSPLNEKYDQEENAKETLNVVLKLPTMEDDIEYSMDDISQYELSNISGGEI